MEWIGGTVPPLYRDLETGVRGHSRSSKAALFDRANTTLYSTSTVNMPLAYLLPFPRYSRILVENRHPLVDGTPPLRVKPSGLRNTKQPLRISTIRSAMLIQYTRVTDGRTDRRNCRGIYTRMLSHVIIGVV